MYWNLFIGLVFYDSENTIPPKCSCTQKLVLEIVEKLKKQADMLYDSIIDSLLIVPVTKKTVAWQRSKFCLSSGEKNDQTVIYLKTFPSPKIHFTSSLYKKLLPLLHFDL